MKTIFKIIPFLTLLVLFSSCNKETASEKVEGEYLLSTAGQLVINDNNVSIDDYPDASVKIESMGDNLISVTLKNIILANKECTLTGSVSPATKASSGDYTFSATYDDEGMAVNAEGYIAGKDISMKISFEMKYDLIGKWMVGVNASNNPDVYFNLTCSTDSIEFDGEKYKISDLVSMVNTLILPQAVAKAPLSYIEFTEKSYFNLYSNDAEVMSSFNEYVNNKIEFYSDATYIYFTARKSYIDALNEMIKDYGITIPSFLSIGISYKLDGDNLNVELNKGNTILYLTTLKALIPSITYQQFKAVFPDSEITEENFADYKAIVITAMNIFTETGTSFAIGMNMIPYAEGARPWQIK